MLTALHGTAMARLFTSNDNGPEWGDMPDGPEAALLVGGAAFCAVLCALAFAAIMVLWT
jgi:hypothetical protein